MNIFTLKQHSQVYRRRILTSNVNPRPVKVNYIWTNLNVRFLSMGIMMPLERAQYIIISDNGYCYYGVIIKGTGYT